MVTRNLTEAFILMRNNALQTKHMYADQNLSDRMALVSSENLGPDGVELKGFNSGSLVPPLWMDSLEETQYILSRLKTKIDSLIEIHSKLLTRPTLDDHCQEERQIEQLTREIGRAITNGFKQVQNIKNAARNEKKHVEKLLAVNAVKSLSTSLQDQGLRYRTAQNDYLQKIHKREERNNLFFPEDTLTPALDTSTDFWLDDVQTNDMSVEFSQGQQKQDSVLLQIEDIQENVKLASEREHQVDHIVKSISELHHIFKELAHMVHDQGTVLDRIDYNIENTQVHVHEGYQQLKKAEAYQRANRKLYCILVLASSIILLSFLIIIFKT